MPTQKARQVVQQAQVKLNKKGGREKGYAYLPMEDGVGRCKLPFVDAPGSVELKCTQEDIDGAVCGHPLKCVLARMFKRTFGALCTSVRVIKKYIYVIQGTGNHAHAIRFVGNSALKKSIHTFDASKGLRGFTPGETYTMGQPPPSDARNGRPVRRHLYTSGTKGTGMQGAKTIVRSTPTRTLDFLPPTCDV